MKDAFRIRFLICYQLLRLIGVRAGADFAFNTTDGHRV